MSKSKKRSKNKKKEKKNTNSVPVRNKTKALVVVEKKKMAVATIFKKEVFQEVVKKVSLALIGTASIAYIALMVIVATSVFYVSHLKNGLIQKRCFCQSELVYLICHGDEALQSLNSELNGKIPEAIILQYKGNTYALKLTDLGIQFDLETAVQEAYSIGRTQNVVRDLWDYIEVMNHTVDIDSQLQYNDEVLKQQIYKVAEQLPEKVTEYQ